jgi:hypothetical protein
VGQVTTAHAAHSPFRQDGPAWWAARQAITEIKSRATGRNAARGAATGFRIYGAMALGNVSQETGAGTVSGSYEQLVNAFLICRDEIAWKLSERDARLFARILSGRSQSEAAAEEGITQSAVSQRLQRSGIHALIRAHEFLGRG